MKINRAKRIGVYVVIMLFFISVPFAMLHNLNYDRYGKIHSTPPTIFIQICMIDTPTHNHTFRIRASEYMAKHNNIKIFIIALSTELVTPMNHDIRIVRDDTTLHAFISGEQTTNAIRHSNDFLTFVATQSEITIKIHHT